MPKWQNSKIVLSWIFSRRSSLEAGSASLLSFPQKRSKTHSKTITIIIIIIINMLTTTTEVPQTTNSPTAKTKDTPNKCLTQPTHQVLKSLTLPLHLPPMGKKHRSWIGGENFGSVFIAYFFAMH